VHLIAVNGGWPKYNVYIPEVLLVFRSNVANVSRSGEKAEHLNRDNRIDANHKILKVRRIPFAQFGEHFLLHKNTGKLRL
jgi:hypothetical protein